MGSSPPTRVIQWLLDTRTLWPEARQTRELETHASRALALLRPEDRDKVFRHYHVRDAKMVLASHLLKHYLIARTAAPAARWFDIHLARDAHQKPIYLDPSSSTGRQPVYFNVSHQAGLVALAAVSGYGGRGEVDVGVDLVCTSERRERDRRSILEAKGGGGGGGWAGYVDIYADVFARSEVNYLKHSLLTSVPDAPAGPGTTEEEVVDFKLRCFYTLWCLREAYVKMTAEALMAEWLGALEFRRFVPPWPTAGLDVPARAGTAEVVDAHEIVFRGRKVDDVKVDMRALGPDYMVCTAVRTRPEKADGLAMELGGYEVLDIEEIVAFAEARL